MSKAQSVWLRGARGNRRLTPIGAVAAGMVVVLIAWLAIAFGQSAHAAGGCGTAANPIVCENALPGTDPSVWDISGAGADDIQGFSTDISVNVGGTIQFKIDTDAKAYTIQIFRTGWYQGLGARKIADVTPSATLPQTQPQCLWDASTELTDCGNWGVSASWNVPSDAVSGVYIALLTRPDTGEKSQITFIVRNEASHSAVLFQTSDPTWQAYNTYGGSDFYQGAANGRAYKISYNRPVVTRDYYDGRDFYFANEYPAVRFLERNGYDVSYFSGVDTDRFGADLKNHKVFLSVGHDEYWSAAQRNNVIAARDAGVNLQFLSGNEMYWHTRYEPSVAGTPTNYRTLVSYKETWSNAKIDPSAEWTGTYRDPRFASQANGAGIPENAVTGTMYQSTITDMAVTVTAAQGKTRMWRNTGLSSMAAGATTALAPHTVGYESDEDVDNGFRPAGLVQLSTTTGAVTQEMLDFGSTVGPGTTTHHVTLYRAPSGALVFSAGSIQWTWGLDQEHDGDGAAADVRMQQAQVNLLADMGAQPATLMSGLVAATASTDKTPPTVTITTPAANASIANGAAVTVSGTASDVGGVVAGVEVSSDNGASWHPATGTTSWSYTYNQQGMGTQTIKVRATDDSGNYASTPASRTVTSAGPNYTVFGTATPAVADAGDPAAVELGLKFTPSQNGYISGVRFYKSAANTGTHTGSLWDANGNRLATVTFTNETASGWQSATFSSFVPVTSGTTYTVSYSAPNGHYAAKSLFWSYRGISAAPLTVAGGFGSAPAGVYNTTPGLYPTSSYQQANYYVDAIFTATDTSPLSASGQWPLPGSSSVATGTSIGAVFSKDVNASTIAFTVKDQLGATVPGTVSYAAATRTATFTPTSALNGFVAYSVALTAKDTLGQTISSGQTWSFTTARPDTPVGTCPCGVFTDYTVPTTLQVTEEPVTLGLSFSSSVAGTVSGMRFYKSAGNTGTHVGTLWSNAGVKLATATFTGESTAGWQSVTFSSPVTINTNTVYTVSYRSTSGSYSVSPGALSSPLTVGPLTVAAGGGAYSYPDAYPGYSSTSSYLVDVIFNRAASPISVTAQTPPSGAIGVATSSPISMSFSVPIASGYTVAVTNGSTAISGTTTLSSDGQTVTFTPAQALPAGATIAVAVSGVTSTQGVALPTQNWSFTTAAAQQTSYTLFGNETPNVLAATDDSAAVELGMSFTPSQSGTVSAIRFFKGATNTGTHTGTIWGSDGTQLATVTFANETASGWQTAQLSTPLSLTAGQTYVVGYLAPKGNYSYTAAYFAQAKTSGPLTAAATTNGRYLYGAAGGLPTYSYNATNYFVDVVFTPDGTSTSGGSTGSGSSGSTPTPSPTPTPTPTPTPNPLAGASIFPDASTPANAAWPDGRAVQLGVRFTATQAGSITGIRFYKGAGDTGTHTASLWTANGTRLATAAFTGESASGWQDVYFTTPVAIQAGVEYRASYYTTGSTYAVTAGALANPVTNGSLATLATGGAYSYSTGFPDQTVTHNYWVDVHFVASQ